MKRSTFMAIAIIVFLTILLVVMKLIYPDSNKEAIKTVLAGKEWLNMEFGSDRMELKGKTTLVVFWNYTDITSKKTLKKVMEWKGKYSALLQVAGVHSPEFTFEKEIKNIKKSVEELKIKFPVVLDNNAELKAAFKNEAVPALYIISKEGKVVFSHSGDGDYEVSETAIREALAKAAPSSRLPEFIRSPITGLCFPTTLDLYLSISKGAVANKEGLVPDKSHNYKAIKEILEDSIALTGKFKASKESLGSDGTGAVVSLNFTAMEVNLVAEASNDEATLEVLLNGKPVKKDSKGKNLDDKNQVKLKGPGLYQLIKNKNKPEKGILTIKNLKGDYRLYAFRFYGCSE
ncbi:MAG: hypothetical protein A2231_08420 [Candidatus Firestonebacteria bacterium RIFOXYA2_FULL_40_8]|nr:MAG: hypothetical protein A2231_08420 [Candidatus Firestonebacteria bacterium RIFOXYA2_FULL_40_8]